MIIRTIYKRRFQGCSLRVAGLVIILNLLFMPSITPIESHGDNMFHITLNGKDCGYVGSFEDIDRLLIVARRNVAEDNEGIVYARTDLGLERSEVIFGAINSDKEVVAAMEESLKENILTTNQSAVTMKIGDYAVNLASMDDARYVLQSALDLYQSDESFVAQIVSDPHRELNAMTAAVITTEEAESASLEEPSKNAGFDRFLESVSDEVSQDPNLLDFDDYSYGLESMEFADSIEIASAYLPSGQIKDTEKAKEEIIVAQEVNSVYEVQSGDTLSKIAINVNIPMERIIAMNDTLDDENSTIRIGDKLVVTMPEPLLSVSTKVQEYIEEIYDAEIEYILNDDWYTTERVTRQQPSAGFRNIVAEINYRNEREVERNVIKEEVLLEAVPKIVEKGTKIPPTYIKPLAGGRLSSNFGYRKRPTKGASTNHQGIDWSTPVGTSVVASCGGTVAHAGWMGGYGYCVFINHPDGRQTRYAHLSKVLVSKGQSVSQGQLIARSGNTGVSTGPHLHFEIRIGGSAVNPLKYLN